MRNLSRHPRAIILLFLTLLLHAQLPSSALAFSISEERAIGEKLLYTVRTAFPLLDDPDLSQYLEKLGREVLEVSGLRYFDYHFFVINDNEFNAFAAPSGLIFFYSGLIMKMNSEDELVSVLAHEIGHVAKRHLAGRIESGKLIGAASIAVALAALALGGGAASQALITSSLAAGQSASLHFSRKDEEEADLLAYGWLRRLGRDPEGQRRMLETMRRISRYRSERLPQYLLTHPDPEARLDYVQSLLVAEGERQQQEKTDEFNFLRFKYRVMSQVQDTSPFRPQLAGIMGDGHASPTARAMARFGLALIEARENNYTRSLELLNEVIAALPEREELLVDLAAVLFASGRYVEAMELLERQYARQPANLYCAYLLGRVATVLGNYQRAETVLKQVSYSMPEYSKVYFELGSLAAKREKSATASLYLGKYYLYEGKTKLAKFSLAQALRDPGVTPEEKTEIERMAQVIKRLEEK